MLTKAALSDESILPLWAGRGALVGGALGAFSGYPGQRARNALHGAGVGGVSGTAGGIGAVLGGAAARGFGASPSSLTEFAGQAAGGLAGGLGGYGLGHYLLGDSPAAKVEAILARIRAASSERDEERTVVDSESKKEASSPCTN